MKLNFLKLSAIALCVSFSLSGQDSKLINGRGCATAVPPAGWDEAFNKKVDEYKQNVATGRTQAAVYTIPVIVHVIYSTGTQTIVGNYPNVSQAQINSQIDVLNADYAGAGLNVNTLASTAFSAVGAADCGISFCLAQLDPDGNLLDEPGIDRVSTTTLPNTANPTSFSSQTSFQNYIDGTVKPNTIWDPTLYFNIWITAVNSNVGLLGYSTFPALSGNTGLVGSNSTMADDGIWVAANAFGNVGTLQSPYNKGRTASHETGHYLGLRHIGGDGQTNGTGNGVSGGDCTATDYCNDTPAQKGGFQGGSYGQNYGAPTYPLHAGVCTAGGTHGDMFMNFMDYCDDAITIMFTPDQRTRMQTSMTNSPYRAHLSASSASLCSIPSTMPASSFAVAQQACTDTLIQVDNQSTGYPQPYCTWSSIPSSGVSFHPSANSPTPTIKFTNPGTYSITMIATNSAGTNTSVKVVSASNCAANVDGIAQNSILYKGISLAPNPSSGLVNIFTNLPSSQNLDVAIHNALGQLVYSVKYTGVTSNIFSLNLESYPTGVYSVTISNNFDKLVKRLILSK